MISVIPSILTPDMVNRMDDETLIALAAESEDVRVDREYLSEQLEVLKQGLEKCRRYGGRQSSGKRGRKRPLTLAFNFNAHANIY